MTTPKFELDFEKMREDIDLEQLNADLIDYRDQIARLRIAIENIAKERDEWIAKHKECTRLIGESMQDTTNLSIERDALKYAARLALDALVETRDNGLSWDAEYDKAIAALKAVL